MPFFLFHRRIIEEGETIIVIGVEDTTEADPAPFHVHVRSHGLALIRHLEAARLFPARPQDRHLEVGRGRGHHRKAPGLQLHRDRINHVEEIIDMK